MCSDPTRGTGRCSFGPPAVHGDRGEKTWRDESGRPRSKRPRVVRVSDCGQHRVTETSEQTTASENGVLLCRSFKQGALAGLTRVLHADGLSAAEARWEAPSPRAGEVLRYDAHGAPNLHVFTQGARRGEMHEYSPGGERVAAVYMGPHVKEGERHHFGQGANGEEELRQVSFLSGHPRHGERLHYYRGESGGAQHLCTTFEPAHASAGRRVFFDEEGRTLAVYRGPPARRWAEQRQHAGCRNSAECREAADRASGRVLCTFCCQLLLRRPPPLQCRYLVRTPMSIYA